MRSGKHSLPGLWRMIDSLPADCRPRMIRGDVSYGNEDSMIEAEKRNQCYLFKLLQTTSSRGRSGSWNAMRKPGAMPGRDGREPRAS